MPVGDGEDEAVVFVINALSLILFNNKIRYDSRHHQPDRHYYYHRHRRQCRYRS